MSTGERWTNNAEKILIAELGQEEYENRLKKQDEIFKKASEEGNLLDKVVIQWRITRLKAIFSLATKSSGKRATHPEGVGATGFGKVVETVPLPENDFFIPGRLFEIRARHSNFPYGDDTKLGVRSLSIKFADHEEESPLDLICHTGPRAPFFNADSFTDLGTGLRGDVEDLKKYVLSIPHYLDAHIRGMRRMPISYYHQHYYAQTVYDVKHTDGLNRLARFRIIPTDGRSESGKLSEEQQKDCWNMDSPMGTSEAKDYLKQEFADSLKKGNIEYTLQVQLHEFPTGAHVDHDMYNPATECSAVDHPWRNLMKITLTTLLPPDVTEITRFNVGHYPPDVLGFKEPMTHQDFNMVPYMRSQVYSFVAALRPSEPEEIKEPLVEYVVTVVTGKKKNAGSDSDISISIIGNTNRTSFRKLDTILRNDFERDSSRTYRVKDKDVGEILCIKVHKKAGSAKHNWYLGYITIATKTNENEKKTYTFPCYRWLSNKVPIIALREGSGILLQSENHPYLKLLREIEVQEKHRLYQWRKRGLDPGFENFPGFIAAWSDSDALPLDAQFDSDKCLEIEYTRALGKRNALLGKVINGVEDLLRIFKGDDVIHEKKQLISPLLQQSVVFDHIIENWESDEEFGRQLLQGINPVKITRVDELPENFPVTDDMVEDRLEPGKSLIDEIKAGRIYIVSYPELEEFTQPFSDQTRFLCAPMCLLYSRNGQLSPIAIQLTQTPAQNTPIFTRKDHKGHFSDWLVAKTWVRVADTNLHQLSTHLLGTHLVMEPIAISVMRNLPSMHPLFKLLIPHLQFVMAINTLGRKVLIPHGTAISQILGVAEHPGQHVTFMEKMYEKFTFSSLDIPKSFGTRGVSDTKLLPGYYYRDDSLVLWKAISDFVQDIINIYYKTNEVLEADMDLASMMEDLKTNGYHENARLRPSFKKKEDLVHFLTTVIFCCSCQHAAVNFGQLDYYGFSPNAPTCLMTPPPTAKSVAGMDDAGMRKLLPTHEISQVNIGVMNLLSMFSDTEVYLGDYPDKYFTEPEPQAAIRRFQSCLKDISAIIHRRNENLQCPYTYLLPERVPNSIAI